MARSRIRRRQEAERERIDAYCVTLRRAQRVRREAPDFERAIAEASSGYETDIVREACSWRPKIKSRDAARLRLAAARHLFVRYPVPAALEAVWLDDAGLDAGEVALRKRWFIVAARGGSLHREAAGAWLSRKEVHYFLNAADDLSFEQAFWYAIARGMAEDAGVARRVARSKIARMPRAALAIWREAARFFCANPAPLAEMDDLCDFIADRHARDGSWSLKGRTLASLRRQMEAWHRDLAAIRRIEEQRRRYAPDGASGAEGEAARWTGSPLADWSWQAWPGEARSGREGYAIVQLRTAQALVEETRAMHHCVWTYASKCILGHASIWSLRRVEAGRAQRLLTIEVDQRHRAVQVRGFANRLAHPDEERVLARWAKARGIALL